MAAAITHLREWGWQASTLLRWTRPETPLMMGNELDLQQPWWKLEKVILQEAKNQRINRLASKPHYHNQRHRLAHLPCCQEQASGPEQALPQHMGPSSSAVQGGYQDQGMPPLPRGGHTQAHSLVVQLPQNPKT